MLEKPLNDFISPALKKGASVEVPSKPASVVVICPFLKSRRLVSETQRPSLDGEGGENHHALFPSEEREGEQESPLQSSHQQADLYKSQEAEKLCGAIHLRVLYTRIVYLEKIRPSTYFGSGFLEELKNVLTDTGADLLYVDAALSPVQQRNLERFLKVKAIDRTGLILEIFGARARTAEGMLQVELAALTYQRSRLVRSWTHLERQRGGFGFLGGPGESQIELDRRLIGERIAKIRKELERVVKTRQLHRRTRQKVPYPVIALVGYTNSGKSTLFNRMTGAKVMAKDLLFATLDPTMRSVTLPSGRKAILSDTVGFFSDLPTHLVAAFRATLEEVQESDVVLHVRDVSSPLMEHHGAVVKGVLGQLGITCPDPDHAYLEVFNKIDLLEPV